MYERLYHELAWAYDAVSWLVSGGRWRAWQRAALPHVIGPRVLEIGCGPGHLLAELSEAGFQAVGIDRSPAMWNQAHRRLARSGLPGRVIAADARALPFAAQAFNSVVLTFPTPIVRDLSLWNEAARVLRPGGRFVIVLGARSSSRVWPALIERIVAPGSRAQSVTEVGQTGGGSAADVDPSIAVPRDLFSVRTVNQAAEGGIVHLVVARRLPAEGSATGTAR